MFCGKCGAILPQNAVMCPVCGAAVDTTKLPKQPKSKKKLIMKIALIVLAVALVVGVVAFIIIQNSPLMQIKNAAENSFDEFREALGEGGEDFNTMLDIIEEAADDNAYTANLELSQSNSWYDEYWDDWDEEWYEYGGETSNSVSINLNYDGDAEEMSAEVRYKTYYYYFDDEYDEEEEESHYIEGCFYADDEELLLYIEDLDDEVYCIPLADFGEKFSDSDLYDEVSRDARNELEELDVNLFADTSIKEFKSAYDDVYDSFMDSANIEKTDEDIPGVDSDDMKVYRADIDPEEAMDFAGYYAVFGIEQLFGEDALEDYKDEILYNYEYNADRFSDYDITLYAGIDDGNLVALSVVWDNGRHEYFVTLSLEGDDNIWDEFYVYYGEDGDVEDEISGGIESKKNGFEIYFEVYGETCSLVYKSDKITVYYNDYTYFEAKLDVDDDNEIFTLSFVYDGYDVVLEYGVLQEDPEKPDGDKVDVFEDMDIDDIEDIIYEIEHMD